MGPSRVLAGCLLGRVMLAERRVFIQIEETRLSALSSIKMIGVDPYIKECLLWGDLRRVPLQQHLAFSQFHAEIKGVNQSLLTGEVVIHDAGTGARALCEQRDGCVVETALDDEFEHRIQYFFLLVSLRGHSSCQSKQSLECSF